MSSYDTEHKKLLLEFLSCNKDKSMTIDEISDGMSAHFGEGVALPGKSTLYRLVNRLLEEGSVRKFIKRGTRRASYVLVQKESCHAHLHLKCSQCGKLFHMKDAVSEELLRSIRVNCGFAVDEGESVLFGRCKGCIK